MHVLIHINDHVEFLVSHLDLNEVKNIGHNVSHLKGLHSDPKLARFDLEEVQLIVNQGLD